LADILHTVPSLLLALVVLFVLQPSILNLIIVLGVTRTPLYMRTARAQTLEVRERVFVEVARSLGASHYRIISRDIAPLVFPTIRTLAMLEVATVILAAASLTFLGIGLQRPDVDWGMMVADGRAYLKSAWFVTVFPGVVIVLTAISANIFSNWLRAIEDPANAAYFLRKRRRKVDLT
jgi:peptide/nickel transport system permease protein